MSIIMVLVQLVLGLFAVRMRILLGSQQIIPVFMSHFRFAITQDTILLLQMVELVELFVVIAATVDQDVVLPVMQVMCSTAAIFVHFLSCAILCIGYVEELFRLLILQLTHHLILQLTHHPILQLTLQLLHPILQFIHHFIHPVLRLTHHLVLQVTHHLVLHPLRLHPMVKGHVLLDGYNMEESVSCLVQHIQRQTRIMLPSTILSVPSLHALATPSP